MKNVFKFILVIGCFFSLVDVLYSGCNCGGKKPNQPQQIRPRK